MALSTWRSSYRARALTRYGGKVGRQARRAIALQRGVRSVSIAISRQAENQPRYQEGDRRGIPWRKR